MLNKEQCDRYAQVLWWGLKTARQGRYRRGDAVVIRFDRDGLPLAESVYQKIVDEGLNPLLRLSATPIMQRHLFENASNRQLAFRPPGDDVFHDGIKGTVTIIAPSAITHLADIDPDRINRVAKARRTILKRLRQREMAGDYAWTLCIFPTSALAQTAGCTPRTYARQVVKACFLNASDPVASWQAVHRQVGRIKQRLGRMGISKLHVASNRIDLTLSPGTHRRWLGVSGRNIPSFEVFVSPDWRQTQGRFFADQTSFRSGQRIKGVQLVFQDGRVVQAKADQGDGFLQSQLGLDAGAKRLGEFSLTDRRFSPIRRFMANTLYDENFGGRNGNCHVALGAAYANAFDGEPHRLTPARRRSLGFNDSILHWDLVNTEPKRVSASVPGGKQRLIYENGEFLI